MRWVSFGGSEFAFLSIGGQARGIIAIGGVAHGVVAIGGVLSVGVVSIGMNAVGSVVALGMNTAAPISVSLINALGIYVLAGVNGCGTFTLAGVNASGSLAHGGTNSDPSWLPTVIAMLALLVGSSVFRGTRAIRTRQPFIQLRRFVRSGMRSAEVRARLVSVADDRIELADGARSLTAIGLDESVVAGAHEIAKLNRPEVIAVIERGQQIVVEKGETGYRQRPAESEELVYRCVGVRLAPQRWGFLPRDEGEVQWIIAWSARIAAVVAMVVITAWFARSR